MIDEREPQPGSQEPRESIRTEPEKRMLKERLAFVTQICSRNYGVRLIPGQSWAAGLSPERERLEEAGLDLEVVDEEFLKPDILSYREEDLLARSERYCFAVLRHEIAHLKYSDFRLLKTGMEQVREEGYQPADFQLLSNGIEDPRVNLEETKGSRRAQERLATIYQEDFPVNWSRLKDAPLPVQYQLLVVGEWAQEWAGVMPEEDLAEGLDPRVKEVYQATKEAAQEAVSQTDAKKSHQTIREKIWPEFKKLIDQYLEEQAEQEFSQEQQEKEEGGQQPDQREFDQLPEEEKEKYGERARERLDQAEEEFNDQFGPKTVEIAEQEDGTLTIEPKEIDPEDIKEADREAEEREKETEARMAEQWRREAEDHRQRSQALARLRERREGLTEGERKLYQQYKKGVTPQIRELERSIDQVLPPKPEYGWRSRQHRGQRLDRGRLAREVATKHGQMFDKREMAERRVAVFTLLVDVSGSMRGEKIQSALRSAIMLAEALDKKGLAFEILVFHSQSLELKGFDDSYDGSARRKLIGMLQEAESRYADATDQGFAVDWAAKRLQQKRQRLKSAGALIVITDGAPEPVAEHSGPEWELKSVVKRWQGRLPIVGLGIGSEMEENIRNYYGKSGVWEGDINRQPQALLKILKSQLSRMKKKG